VPTGIRLKGDNMSSSQIFALPTFPANTPVVSIGPIDYLNPNNGQPYYDSGFTQPDDSPVMKAGLEDLAVIANGSTGSIGIASWVMEENSYLHNVGIYGYDVYGFDCESYGCQNFSLDKIYATGGTSNPNTIQIHLNFANSRNRIEGVTLTGNSTGSTTGILVEHGSEASISDIHCENLYDCVRFDTGSYGEVDNIFGQGSPLHTLVHFTAAAGGGIVHQSFSYGSPVNVQDDIIAQSITDQYIALYTTQTTSGTRGNTFSSSQSVTNQISKLNTSNIQLASANFSDGGNYTVVQTGPLGFVIQKSGQSAQGFAGGGLQLMGNGWPNDPSWGGFSAGVSSDMGTFTARAPSANAMLMEDGTISFLADTGLTAGSIYGPTAQVAISPAGMQIAPRTANPGCTTANQVGRLWMNNSVTPAFLSTCVSTGSGYSWNTPVTSVFGRTGSSIATQTGDYLASQVTNAVDQTQSYSNPGWITSFPWSKLTGVPNIYGTVQTGGTGMAQRAILNFAAPFTLTDNSTLGSTGVAISQASAAASGYLAAGDWTNFNAKAGTGVCGTGQFVTGNNSAGGPTCAQPAFPNVTGAASKAQQYTTTTYTDQSNDFTTGTQDFTAASHTKPVKYGPLASIPSTCIAGEFYYASDQMREALKQCNSAGVFQNAQQIVTNGLIADYWMGNCDGTTGSGTTLADCSGSGNAATVPSGGNPAWTQQGLAWTTTAAYPVVLPTPVLNGFTTVQIYADMSLADAYNNTAQIQVFLSAGSNIVLWGNTQDSTPICCGLMGAWKGGTGTQEINPAIGPNLFTYILDNASDTLCIGANCNLSYYTRNGNNPSSRTGPLVMGGNYATGQMNGTIYRAIFYNRELSAAEVAQNDKAIDSWIKYKGVMRGAYVPPSSAYNLVCVGDSITQGHGATPACGSSLLSGLSSSFQIYNEGMAGELLANMQTAEAKFATAINPSGAGNIAWLFGGTNDICTALNALTPSQTLQKMIALSRYMHGQGAKVLVIPMLSRTGSYQATTCDALHDQYNTLLAQNWPSFADAFSYGVLNDPNLTADGAWSNGTYFQSDGIHPTTAGQQLIAQYTTADINNLLSGTVNFAGIRDAIVAKTTSYTASLGDSVILCNASAGPVTITLPTAVGIQGRSFQIKKTDASANACTVATTGAQTMDGASSVPLTAQYASKKVESDNSNWQVIQ
jgi:lysophospholipase L1-like esterase